MAMFWEFFTFEIRFRDQEHFHLRLFSGLARLLVSLRRVGELRPGGQLQRQSPAQRPLGQLLQRSLLLPVWRDRHGRHFRHIHPARFPARHLPDPLHQAHLQVRLSGRPLGRLFRHHPFRVFGNAVWNILRHVRTLGRSRPHRAQPSLVVSPAVSVHHRRPDFLPGLAVLYGRRTHPQDLHRLSAGCCHFHALHHRDNGLLRHALAGALLVRHPGPGRLHPV